MNPQAEAPQTVRPSDAQVKPFRFCTSLVLQESTGLRASTLPVLVKLIREVPASSIYYHTHFFLLSHHYLTPEPTNDFAYWVTSVLGEEALGELLASIDIMGHASLESLREALAGTIEAYLEQTPTAKMKFVSDGAEFFFLKSIHLVMPTPYTVSTLAEFSEALERVSIRSLYFHMFDARLRVGQSTNDFTVWVTEQLGLHALGMHLSRLDPYLHDLETLRATILSLIRNELH